MIHGGLDTIARTCRQGRRGPRSGRAPAVAERLVALSRRYPRARFSIEPGGERGSMLSVLLVARAELVPCSAAGVAAIDRALPRRIRRALPPARSG